MKLNPVNLQALLALALFGGALLVSRGVMNIHRGTWPGGEGMILYLRTLLGFLMAAAITLGFYAFAGKDILSGW